MVLVEFYDKKSIENMISTFLCRPTRTVFVGGDAEEMERSLEAYRAVLETHGIPTELTCRAVSPDRIDGIFDLLDGMTEEILDSGEVCRFDLTGGGDLYLVAVGKLLGKYGDRVSCHRFDAAHGLLVDGNGAPICSSAQLTLSVGDSVRLYGGTLRGSEVYRDDPLLSYAVDVVWELNTRSPKRWNAFAAAFARLLGGSGEALSFSIEEFERNTFYSSLQAVDRPLFREYCTRLGEAGILQDLSLEHGISFSLPNLEVRRLLTVAGRALELRIGRMLASLCGEDGEPLCRDVHTSVRIDWDNDENDEDPFNEIDVLATAGFTPVFISCKNGNFRMEELYKLHTVAERFGSRYSGKAIVTTEISPEGIEERGELLGVDILNLYELGSDTVVLERLREICTRMGRA